MRYLILFTLLFISLLGVVHGFQRGTGEQSLRTTLFLGGGLIGFVFLYLLVVVSISLIASLLKPRSPKWADRLLRLQGRITGGETHTNARMDLHLQDPRKCDELWNQAKLSSARPDEAMALAMTYAVSLSRRGQLKRARDLMLQHPPQRNSRLYEQHYALYWLNLGWYQQELEDQEQAEYCLRRASLEKLTNPQLKSRQSGLRALLAYQAGDRQEALLALREADSQWTYLAWLLAEMGEMEEAARRLPELSSVKDRVDRTYHHLTTTLVHKDRAALEKASQSGHCAGKVAYYALHLFGDDSYLSKALEHDPEGRWTRRARELQAGLLE